MLSVFLFGCQGSIKPEKLYGDWKYVKVENLDKNQEEDNISDAELAEQNPSIHFSPDKKLQIIWGGKVLSEGTFRLEGNMIRYKENLPGGTTREFPFLVKKLDDKELVFETMSRQGTRVTAKRAVSL